MRNSDAYEFVAIYIYCWYEIVMRIVDAFLLNLLICDWVKLDCKNIVLYT